MMSRRGEPAPTLARARAVAGHVVMALALGWDVQRASVRDRKPWAKKYVTRDEPSLADDLAEAFVTLAGPVAAGELDGVDLAQRVPDRDVERVRALTGGDLGDFVATVRAILASHAGAVERFASLLLEGDIDAKDIEATLRDDPALRGSIESPQTLVPPRVAGWQPSEPRSPQGR